MLHRHSHPPITNQTLESIYTGRRNTAEIEEMLEKDIRKEFIKKCNNHMWEDTDISNY